MIAVAWCHNAGLHQYFNEFAWEGKHVTLHEEKNLEPYQVTFSQFNALIGTNEASRLFEMYQLPNEQKTLAKKKKQVEFPGRRDHRIIGYLKNISNFA